LPADHPVIFELKNPKGQVVQTARVKESLNGFYLFQTSTAPDAPTGNWTVRAHVGGASFEKVLKIETVVPNRLKVKLDLGPEGTPLFEGEIKGKLSAAWLHGAVARNLKTDVEAIFTTARTGFKGYEGFVFDDPSREYKPESLAIFDGTVDETGKAEVASEIKTRNLSPGMLTAHFRTRVFEPGGAFSVDRVSYPYHPYTRYVGLSEPPGDKTRGMLLTDTKHPAQGPWA
jgi:uncharacterized protein YfaS (alpha-2-macroglobulin family)